MPVGAEVIVLLKQPEVQERKLLYAPGAPGKTDVQVADVELIPAAVNFAEHPLFTVVFATANVGGGCGQFKTLN